MGVYENYFVEHIHIANCGLLLSVVYFAFLRGYVGVMKKENLDIFML